VIKMLYNLDFIHKDEPWPPQEETTRLDTYQVATSIIGGDHVSVFPRLRE